MTRKQGWAAIAAVAVFAVAASSAPAATRPALPATIAAAMKRSPPPPLTTPERAQAAARLSKAPPPTTMSSPISISPGASYKDGFSMSFTYPNVVGASSTGGLAALLPDNDGYVGSMTLKFHVQLSKGYLIDCRTTAGVTDVEIRLTVGEFGPPVATWSVGASGGHFSWFLLPTATANEEVRYDISPINGGALVISGCELTTIG